MDFNVGIIDQQVRKLVEDYAGEFARRFRIQNDDAKKRSMAFVFLCVKTMLDLDDPDALPLQRLAATLRRGDLLEYLPASINGTIRESV
ncbi:MAG: hypothetical protein LBW77_00650 [Verrucomicrobiota bacterium]|jgi:AAA+ superfamily predicted ATPase|nr:hypothetical protein [Verrucomicrobiota bacterium]